MVKKFHLYTFCHSIYLYIYLICGTENRITLMKTEITLIFYIEKYGLNLLLDVILNILLWHHPNRKLVFAQY